MELKLVVLAGAKEGTQIPLKKDRFVIGRASECTLRAGSSAISRRHCAIVRKEGTWFVRDLGSRNGTFLNESAVQTPTPLKAGDEIRVGPLHFRVEEFVKAAGDAQAAKRPAEAKAEKSAVTDAPADINRAKQPPVKDVAEVAQRTVAKGDGSTSEDDISRWLLGIEAGTGDALRETQTLSLEETTAVGRTRSSPSAAEATNGEAGSEDQEAAEAPADKAAEEKAEKSSGWGLFTFGKKGGAKKKPGKLPPRPADASKDSREAAADILREMTRRR